MTPTEALQLIATPMRPDGTWNRDREACRQIAADALASMTTDPTAALKLAREALAYCAAAGASGQPISGDIAADALAAIDALPAPSGEPAELEKAHEARRQAQREAEALKERMARARLDLMRELREQGWTPPAAQPAPAVAAEVECDALSAWHDHWRSMYETQGPDAVPQMFMRWFTAGYRAAERAHGITATPAKG